MNGMLGGNLFHEVLRLVDGAQVGTDSDLGHIGKPSRRMASFSLEGVMPGNWLMKAGGHGWPSDLVTGA